jgi:hypothetical protein
MPIWALLYLLLFLALNLHGLWEKSRRAGFHWRSVVDIAELVALTSLYVAYWNPWSWGRLGPLALVLYVALLVESLRGMDRIAREAARLDEVPAGDWIDVVAAYVTNLVTGWLVLAVLCFPILIIAGLAAVRLSCP